MANRPLLPLGALALASLLSSPAQAQAQAVELIPFPFAQERDALVEGTLEFQPVANGFVSLMGKDSITLDRFPIPGAGEVQLNLESLRFDPRSVGVQVNGQPDAYDPGDLTLWKGSVVGDRDSEVFLAFSSYGTHGWVKNQGEFFHVLAFPAEGNDWANSKIRVVPDTVMQSLNVPDLPKCNADSVNQPGSGIRNAVPDFAATTANLGTLLECKVSVETDYQFYQNFGNLTATQNYAMALLGAISDRYADQVEVVLTYPYLQFYTSSNDPWTAQNQGAGAMLDQFRAAWLGNIPAGGHLGHFVSGANLGGGVAYLDALCSQNIGFGVSGNLHGGTQFPVQQSSNTWDFVVVAHELGHNFGTPHTHDYNPQIDNCAGGACTNQGTIMSYCHFCGGGMNNITTFFHPTVVADMRGDAVNSCLPPYMGDPGCTTDSLEENDSCTTAMSIGAGSYNGLSVCDDDLDYYRITVAAGEQITCDLDFVDSFGNIECRLADDICFDTHDQGTTSSNNESVTWTNTGASAVDVTLEVYISGSPAENTYNLDVTLVNTDPCVTSPDDSFEENDSCSEAVEMTSGTNTGLFVSKTDSDFYEFCVRAGDTLDVSAFFTHADGDIDIFLYDPSACGGGSGTGLDEGFSANDDETVSWTNTGVNNVKVVLEVNVWPNSADNCNDYDLMVTGAGAQCYSPDSLGSSYCDPANINTRGLRGLCTAAGSSLVSNNNVTLTSYNLPFNQFGYYLCAQTQGLYTNPGGSPGNLCLDVNIGRYAAQAANSGLFGEIQLVIDLSQMPTNPNEPVLAGQTWNFQLWYRDVPSTSGFTNGIEILFQ